MAPPHVFGAMATSGVVSAAKSSQMSSQDDLAESKEVDRFVVWSGGVGPFATSKQDPVLDV